MSENTKKTWLRGDFENDRAFEIFNTFLNLSPSERTSRRVAEIWSLSEGRVKQLRNKYHWNERVRDYDNYMAEKRDVAVEKNVGIVAFDWAKWELENLERTRQITDKLFTRSEQILAMPFVKAEKREAIIDPKTGEPLLDREGNPVHQVVQIVNPMRFSAGDASRFAEAGVVLTQYATARARALAPREAGNHQLPQPEKALEDMTPEEIEIYILQIEQATEAIARGETVQGSEHIN